MAKGRASDRKHRGYWSTGLLVLGLAALLADLAFLAAPLAHVAQNSTHGMFGLLPSVGLSLLQATRSIALHQVDYFSLVARILVLFLSLVALVTGFVLWSARRSASGSGKGLISSASVEGER